MEKSILDRIRLDRTHFAGILPQLHAYNRLIQTLLNLVPHHLPPFCLVRRLPYSNQTSHCVQAHIHGAILTNFGCSACLESRLLHLD